ncbi:hypothetical protein IHE44_0002060 [Lamprotornis superbus]|uniref:Mitochondrial import inner membrane translocase subunit TIM14 n=1 Tax=Lamprotornis superbus TaxID=245042 RepID=A0A835NUQ3_9PASS|nr:hypothetical protein IHE44_0002060 [Lamprotornis superbus]
MPYPAHSRGGSRHRSRPALYGSGRALRRAGSGRAGTMVAVGLAIAAAGFAGRYAVKTLKHMEPQVKQALQNLPKPAFSGYYRGGFEPKMTKREAALILGVSPTANRNKIREAHRRIMLLNHPDKEAVSDSVIPSIRTASSSVLRRRDLLRRLLLWWDSLASVSTVGVVRCEDEITFRATEAQQSMRKGDDEGRFLKA